MLIDQRSYRRKEQLQSSMRIPRTGIVQQWTANGRQFHLHSENEKHLPITDRDLSAKADPLHDRRIEGRDLPSANGSTAPKSQNRYRVIVSLL